MGFFSPNWKQGNEVQPYYPSFNIASEILAITYRKEIKDTQTRKKEIKQLNGCLCRKCQGLCKQPLRTNKGLKKVVEYKIDIQKAI